MTIADERAERVSKFVPVLRAMCKLKGWQFLPYDGEEINNDYGYVRIKPGLQLYFHRSRERGKMQVSVCHWGNGIEDRSANLMRYKQYDQALVSINLSASKTPEAIAADIERRLLPDAEKELEYLRARKNADDATKASTALNAAKLLQSWDKLREYGRQDQYQRHLSTNSNETLSCDFEVGQDSVTIKINSVSVEEAMHIAQFLDDITTGGPECK